MNTAAFAAFFLQLLPVLRELARELFSQHHGSVGAAKATTRTLIERIKDHSVQLHEFEAEINRKMDELERVRAEVERVQKQQQGGQA